MFNLKLAISPCTLLHFYCPFAAGWGGGKEARAKSTTMIRSARSAESASASADRDDVKTIKARQAR